MNFTVISTFTSTASKNIQHLEIDHFYTRRTLLTSGHPRRQQQSNTTDRQDLKTHTI